MRCNRHTRHTTDVSQPDWRCTAPKKPTGTFFSMREVALSEAIAPAASRGHGAWMSRADRRAVRQRVALATKLNLHSVTLLGSVWTLHHPIVKPRPKPRSADRGMGTSAATSRRCEKSAKRLKDFQAATRFRLASVFRWWKQLNQLPPPSLLPSSQPRLAPPPPPPPTVQQDTTTQPPTQQRTEQMDAGGRSKRAPSSPSSGGSPSTPHAKRALLLPDGPLPPSLPPSPPSPSGGQQPPGPSGPNQTREGACRAGSPAATDVRAGSSRRLEFACETECTCFCGATRGLTKIDGYHMCKKCKAEYNSESEPESSSEEESCVSACSDSGDDGGPGPRTEPRRDRITKGISSAKCATTGFPGYGIRSSLFVLNARRTKRSATCSESVDEVSARGDL